MDRLDRLSKKVAELQDKVFLSVEEAPPSPFIGDYLFQRRHARRRRHIAGASLLALVLLGGSLFALRVISPSTPTMAMVRAQSGQTVTATSSETKVAFADGSSALLFAGGNLQTESAKGSATKVRLRKGHVRVKVIHQFDTQFAVFAGPYTIEVTGTHFDVKWRPESGTFSTEVMEGSVRIRGGLLPEPVAISAGQSLILEQGNTPKGKPDLPPAHAPEPEILAPATPLAVPETEAVNTGKRGLVANKRAMPSTRTPGRHLARVDWAQEAQAGRYREALEAAERRGFRATCQEVASKDLLNLAEAARYTGRSGRAQEALQILRARFAASDDAAVAAYLLGRLAAETQRDHPQATQWFRTYLAERPRGKLAREAEGRLLESLAIMDRETAQKAARNYLERYPAGPHAPFARSLIAP